MSIELQEMKTRRLQKEEEIPYELLLLADETREAINRYIHQSDIFVIDQENTILAVCVLYPLDKTRMEIKNIAVAEKLQGQGIGSFLLEDAASRAGNAGYREIIVGTPESSYNLLDFYEKAGFIKYDRKANFYIDNYPAPIIENGVQLRDMIMLKKALTK